MSTYLATTNLDVVSNNYGTNIRFANGLQIIYGFISFEPGVEYKDIPYARPFDGTTPNIGVATWAFAYEEFGYVSYTCLNQSSGRIDCYGRQSGTKQGGVCGTADRRGTRCNEYFPLRSRTIRKLSQRGKVKWTNWCRS